VKWLTRGGAAAALLVGGATLWGVGWRGLVLLLAFFVSASLVTQRDARQRTARQVLANGGVPAVAALLGAWPVFAGALAAAAADTWATEIGARSPTPPRLITSGVPVPHGPLMVDVVLDRSIERGGDRLEVRKRDRAFALLIPGDAAAGDARGGGDVLDRQFRLQALGAQERGDHPLPQWDHRRRIRGAAGRSRGGLRPEAAERDVQVIGEQLELGQGGGFPAALIGGDCRRADSDHRTDVLEALSHRLPHQAEFRAEDSSSQHQSLLVDHDLVPSRGSECRRL